MSITVWVPLTLDVLAMLLFRWMFLVLLGDVAGNLPLPVEEMHDRGALYRIWYSHGAGIARRLMRPF